MTLQLRLIEKQYYLIDTGSIHTLRNKPRQNTHGLSNNDSHIARRGGQRAQRYHCTLLEVYEKAIAGMHVPSLLELHRYGDERTAPDDVQLALKTGPVPLIDRSGVCVCKQRSATLDRLKLNSSSWP